MSNRLPDPRTKIPGLCNEPFEAVPLHPSVRIGGSFVLARCRREPLPTMVVCAWHASPDAVTIAMESMARRNGRRR